MPDQDSTVDAETDKRTPEADNSGSSDADVRRVSEEQEEKTKTKRYYPKNRKPIPLHKRRNVAGIAERIADLPPAERRKAEETKRLLLCGSLTHQGLTKRKIAEVVGISERSVQNYVDRCKATFPLLGDVDHYRESRTQLMETTESLALQCLSERLGDANTMKLEKLRDIAYSFDILHQGGRLERGKSTQNISQSNTFSKLALPPSAGIPHPLIDEES